MVGDPGFTVIGNCVVLPFVSVIIISYVVARERSIAEKFPLLQPKKRGMRLPMGLISIFHAPLPQLKSDDHETVIVVL